MAEQSPRGTSSKKSWPAIIAGIAVVAIAGFFGIDLAGNSSNSASPGMTASTSATQSSSSDQCPINTLPAEAHDTLDDISAGGPFEYPDNDGVRFGNYEGQLPAEPSDYYHEYTVDTPGLNHRGAKRIITGGGSETDPDVVYYTDDHYETFCEVPDA
ncbi:ribonuclease domain-containing protein [Corynebacterium sp. S7]